MNEHMADWFNIDILSPTLFINDLAIHIKNKGIGVHCGDRHSNVC